MGLFSFEDLETYKECRKLVADVYRIVNTLPNVECYNLSSQLRRAAISIVSNVAEGSGRVSYKEKIHFIEIAYGSLMEVYCQLQVCVDLGYLDNELFMTLKPKFFTSARLLSGMRKTFTEKISTGSQPSIPIR